MKNEKKIYEAPELQLIMLATEDILSTSVNDEGGFFGEDDTDLII